MKPIPQEWIKNYVDELIAAAKLFDEHSAMHTSTLIRAEAVMDMVKAWQESKKRTN